MKASSNQRRRQRLVLLWNWAISISSTLASTTSMSRKRFRAFPSVHSVTVDKQELQTSQYSQRVAEMDVVRINCPDEQCRIQALIHSQKELEHFRLHRVPFEFDAEATEAFSPRKLQSNTSQSNTDQYSRIEGFSCFLDYQGTMDFLQDLVTKQNYSHVELQLLDIGDSYLKTTNAELGHDIFALKVSSPAAVLKSPMLILTGVHPREYAPPELVRQWILSFLDPNNLEMKTILYSTDIYWVPYVNPDGRVLAETTQTLRRKNLNREAAGSEYCADEEYGVDLNRNFPFRWGRLDGSSDDPCLQTYHGSGPASEPEIQAVIQLGLDIFPQAQRLDSQNFYLDNPVGYNQSTTTGVFLDIHSWGNLYIYPWGYQNVATPNHNSLTAMANKLARLTGFDVCGPGPLYTATASGASDDWSYSTLGAAGMTWEIGTSFHQDCSTLEMVVLPKNTVALTYAAKLARLPHRLAQGPDVMSLNANTAFLAYNQQLAITFQASDTVYLDGSYYSTPSDLDSVLIYIDQHPYATTDVSTIVQPHWIVKKDELIVGSDGVTLTVMWDWQVLEGRWRLTSQPVEGDHIFYFIAKDSKGLRGPLSAIEVTVAPLPTASPTGSPSLVPSNMPSTTLRVASDPTAVPFDYSNSSSSSSGKTTPDDSMHPTTRSDTDQVPQAIQDPVESLEESEQMTEKSLSERPSTSTMNVIMLLVGLTWIVVG